MQLTYNLYDSVDKNIDKKLLYVPDSSASLLLIYKKDNSTRYLLNYKITGDRILQYGSDWADQVNDKSFGLASFGVVTNFRFLDSLLLINLNIDNLLDEEYISTIGYPEPGKSINLAVEYEL